jgi:hypothetical protein
MALPDKPFSCKVRARSISPEDIGVLPGVIPRDSVAMDAVHIGQVIDRAESGFVVLDHLLNLGRRRT